MVRDVQRAIRFYKSIGFALRSQDVPNDPKYAVIARDGVELHLQWHDAQEWTYPNDRATYRVFLGAHRARATPEITPPHHPHPRAADLVGCRFFPPVRVVGGGGGPPPRPPPPRPRRAQQFGQRACVVY